MANPTKKCTNCGKRRAVDVSTGLCVTECQPIAELENDLQDGNITEVEFTEQLHTILENAHIKNAHKKDAHSDCPFCQITPAADDEVEPPKKSKAGYKWSTPLCDGSYKAVPEDKVDSENRAHCEICDGRPKVRRDGTHRRHRNAKLNVA